LKQMLADGRVIHQPAHLLEEPRSNDNGSLSLEEMERRMIEKALQKHHGNRRLAAQDLQISERTLYRKIKEYGLDV